MTKKETLLRLEREEKIFKLLDQDFRYFGEIGAIVDVIIKYWKELSKIMEES